MHKNLSALVLLLALVGCGSEEPKPDPAPTPTAPARPPAGPTAAESDLVGARAVVLSTGAGTEAHAAAAALKALSAEAGTPIAHVVTPSALEALYFVAAGEAEAAVIPAVLVASPEHRIARDAVEVLATFQGPLVAVHVARGSSIKELMDLEGKRVVLGAPGSALAAAATQLLEVAGLDETSVDASYHGPAEAQAALRAGQVDAIFAFDDQGQVEGDRLPLAEDERAALTERAGVFQVDAKGARASLVLVARRGPTGVEVFAPLVAADPRRLHVVEAPKPAPISGPSLAQRGGTAPLRLAAGPEGGTYEVVAGGLQKVGQGVDVAVLPMRTSGSLSNLLALATGHAELAIVQEDVILEMLRTPTLAPLAARVRLVSPLFQEQVHLAAAGGMTSIEGLRGKRVGCGDPGSGTFFTVRRVMRRAGIGRSDSTLSLDPVGASLESLAAGKLDAVFAVGGAPLPAFDRAKQPFVALADVGGYTEASLGPDQYGWLKAPVTTIATRALLLCRLDLDDTTVKRIVTNLYANRANLKAIHPALGQLVPSALEGGVDGVRIHEGAKAASMGGLEVDTAPGW